MATTEKKVVVLADWYRDGEKVPAGSVVSIPSGDVKALKEQGVVDDNAKAVKHYESLATSQSESEPVHEDDEGEAEGD